MVNLSDVNCKVSVLPVKVFKLSKATSSPAVPPNIPPSTYNLAMGFVFPIPTLPVDEIRIFSVPAVYKRIASTLCEYLIIPEVLNAESPKAIILDAVVPPILILTKASSEVPVPEERTLIEGSVTACTSRR